MQKGIGEEGKPRKNQRQGAEKDDIRQGENGMAYQAEAGIKGMHGLDLLLKINNQLYHP